MNVLISASELSDDKVIKSHKELLHWNGYQVSTFVDTDNFAISLTHYDGYPWQLYEDNNSLIVLEGLIYNKTDAEVGATLRQIADEYQDNSEESRGRVLEFMRSSDGDYLVFIFLKKTATVIIFNDRWARLPTYYSSSDALFSLSREVKFLLHWIPLIELDRAAMAEFLIYEYNLGNKTLVKGIKRLNPATILVVERSKDRVCVTEDALLAEDFTTIDLGLETAEIVQRCVSLFKESLSSRANKVQERGLRITADLSGGFDTRAVFAGLCQLGVPFTPSTVRAITGDESEIARQLTKLYGKQLQSFQAAHPVEDFSAIRQVTYITDCTVNAYTSVSSYYDSLEWEKLNGRSASFGGFGGEFIRHPYRLARRYGRRYGDLVEMLQDDMYTRYVSFPFACALTKLSVGEFINNLEYEVARFPEKNDYDRVKHLYFQYYNKLVNAGENRNRFFSWTAQPLWGKELFTFEMTHIPRGMASFKFFVDFLKRLDKKSLKARIYKRRVRLGSSLSVRLYDIGMRLQELVVDERLTKKLYVRLIRRVPRSDATVEARRRLTSEVLRSYDSSKLVARYFNYESLQEFLDGRPAILQIYQLLTLMSYILEIEIRFSEKMV